MEEKRDFSKPGRGGFPQRRGFYGQARGFNSKSYGNRTWTFYEDEQWENFQRWMKDEKERKRKEETKDLLKGVDEIMQKRLKREKGKKAKKEKETEASDSESSEEESTSEDEEPKKSPRKKQNKKKKGKVRTEWKVRSKVEDKKEVESQLLMKELLESLGRIENKIRAVEMNGRNMEAEIEKLRLRSNNISRESKEPERDVVELDRDSEAEKIQDMFQQIDEEKKHEDRWREIQSLYKGKDGTTKLKEWCTEHEIPYKNKDNALMAVLAAETDI